MKNLICKENLKKFYKESDFEMVYGLLQSIEHMKNCARTASNSFNYRCAEEKVAFDESLKGFVKSVLYVNSTFKAKSGQAFVNEFVDVNESSLVWDFARELFTAMEDVEYDIEYEKFN